MAGCGCDGGGCEYGTYLRYGYDCKLVEVVDVPRLLPLVFWRIPPQPCLSLCRSAWQSVWSCPIEKE